MEAVLTLPVFRMAKDQGRSVSDDQMTRWDQDGERRGREREPQGGKEGGRGGTEGPIRLHGDLAVSLSTHRSQVSIGWSFCLVQAQLAFVQVATVAHEGRVKDSMMQA